MSYELTIRPHFEKWATPIFYRCFPCCYLGGSQADFVLVTKNKLVIEVEHKNSVADLLSDQFKRLRGNKDTKHEVIMNGDHVNRFMYLVHDKLEITEKFIDQISPQYGLLSYNYNRSRFTVNVIRKGELLSKKDFARLYFPHLFRNLKSTVHRL